MSDKVREFYELIHGMNHGDLRRIARSITGQIARREGSAGFDPSDYRDICEILFDCASQQMGEDGFEDDMAEMDEPGDELPPTNFTEPDTGPVSAFARKKA